MHNDYTDIRSRIGEPPSWWDERAVPRYCPFSPREAANIYADEVALVEIECQACEHPFLVAFSCSEIEASMERHRGRRGATIAEQIKDKTMHYGDPPNADCCAAGPTMNCNDIRVVEYWRRNSEFDWVRDPSLEVELSDK
jgi:hypothetical protein